ncbi:unnamed protein product, partial [Discosporangium mesarthrocarpum]
MKLKVNWQPRGRGSRVGKVAKVSSLFDMCLALVADNFQYVESLGTMTTEARNRLTVMLCRQLKLTNETLATLMEEEGVAELILPDCSRIEPSQMLESLLQCRSTLRVLCLGTCGRCLGDDTVEALAREGGMPCLERVTLGGAYRLTDAGVLKLVQTCPSLTGLELPAGPGITRASVEALADRE